MPRVSVISCIESAIRGAKEAAKKERREDVQPPILDSYATADAIDMEVPTFTPAVQMGIAGREDAETPNRRLQRSVEIYVKTQNVVKMDNVYGVYVAEYLLEKPDAIPFFPPARVKQVAAAMRQGDSALTISALEKTFQMYHANRNKKGMQARQSFNVVIIPARIARLIDGTAVDRNSFDSILYHEVAGHARDYTLPSAFLGICAVAAEERMSSRSNMSPAQAVQSVADEIQSFSEYRAYLLEIDRLITQKGFLSNPGVVNEEVRTRIDHTFPFYMFSAEHKVKTTKSAKFQKLLRSFLIQCNNEVSKRTIQFAQELIRRKQRDAEYMRKVRAELTPMNTSHSL